MVTKKKYNIYIEKEKRKNLLQVSFEKTSRWQYIIPRGNQSSGSIRRLFIFKKGEIERLVWGRERKGGRGGGEKRWGRPGKCSKHQFKKNMLLLLHHHHHCIAYIHTRFLLLCPQPASITWPPPHPLHSSTVSIKRLITPPFFLGGTRMKERTIST